MKLKLNENEKKIASEIMRPFVDTFLKCMDKYTCTELRAILQ